MSPLDRQIITRKLLHIQEDLSKLQEFENTTLDKYSQDIETRLLVERLLERIIGRIIDINYHILKEDFGLTPNSYHDSFIQLADKSVIEKQLAEQLAQSTGLRNALAHEYDEIDNSLVHKAIKECLTQIPRYLEQIMTKAINI